MDFWASRIHSAKHQSAAHNSSEIDDDGGAWFPCPFCYVEVEIAILCRHLQEEHCFDLNNAVCPICAANLGKNPIEHFTVQHSHSIKRRRKGHTGSGYNGSRMVMKEFGETYWDYNANSRVNNESELDPLLSPFFSSVNAVNDSNSNQHRELVNNTASIASDSHSPATPKLDTIEREDYEERKQKAEFVQQLIFSTML